MTPATARLLPLAVFPFLLWRVYARLRRNVGLQPMSPHRLIWRILVFTIFILVIAAFALRDVTLLTSLLSGVVAGAVLSMLGLRLTKFSEKEDGLYYRPSTPIGVALGLLFFGRIVYRVMYFSFSNLAQNGMAQPALAQSPLTLFIFGLPAGYYVAYDVALLRHPRNVD